jgi:rhodanese-related sulfurtransferase
MMVLQQFNNSLHLTYPMKTAHDLVNAAKARIQEIPLNLSEEYIRSVDLLIDVREADEYNAGHLPGAVFIPRGMLEFKLSATPELTPRDLNIAVYCKTGGRSALAALTLQDMGYLNVKSISGGFDAWVNAGRETIKPKTTSFD